MILSVESSCDESALALFDESKGVVKQWVITQEIHAKYGGVVPGIAAREHVKNFLPLLQEAMDCKELSEVSEIAVTYGPGLAGSLAVGIALAKALKLALKVPLMGVNHLRGHALSPLISLFHADREGFREQVHALCPHLGLLVSGGNTLLFTMDASFLITILAQTQDDAAGEALDKGAKLLGLPYPGGPQVEQLARSGDRKKYAFPRAYAHQDVMKFSFSGLKTSLYYFLQKMDPHAIENCLPDICASYQEAVFDQLINKVKNVLSGGGFRSVGLSGGVSQNARLRQLILEVGEKNSLPVHCAQAGHSGDNAVMIAFAACVDKGHVVIDDAFDLTFEPSLELS